MTNQTQEQCSLCFGRGYRVKARPPGRPGVKTLVCAGCRGTGQRATKRMTIAQAKLLLRRVGIVMKKTEHNEYRVNLRGGTEATAYYTDDLADAVATGGEMAKHGGR